MRPQIQGRLAFGRYDEIEESVVRNSIEENVKETPRRKPKTEGCNTETWDSESRIEWTLNAQKASPEQRHSRIASKPFKCFMAS